MAASEPTSRLLTRCWAPRASPRPRRPRRAPASPLRAARSGLLASRSSKSPIRLQESPVSNGCRQSLRWSWRCW
ncbi:hypothetical protein D8676_01705 [Mesorhizobium sp. YM1C-6-2]|nr:hypothetical protein D8676_01705 [Mesorhizobium sp. YM1C-6-2]